MTDINTQFDNLTSVSSVKNFDQSQTQELGTLDVPDMYQEFEVIEHEIDRNSQSTSEISLFAEKLSNAKVVRREDVYAFESLVGNVASLPHINSYTMDYSMVNYQVTQESVFVAVNKFVANLAKMIWKYITAAYGFVKTQLGNAFKRLAYVDDPVKQQTVKKTAVVAKEKETAAPTTVVAKVDSQSAPANAARMVYIHKALRKLLYPRFNELGALSLGGEVNISLLVDEMCAQRLKTFYSTFLKAIYERDIVLKNTVAFLTRRINSDFLQIVNKTTELFKQDISHSPVQPYAKLYQEVPEQLTDFLEHFGSKNMTKSSSKDLYKDRIDTACDLVRTMTSIAITHDLPEKRVILALDLDWMGELFNENITAIGRDIQSQYVDMTKSYKIIERNSSNIHPDVQVDMMALYSDWIILNKMATMLAVFRARTDAIYQNIDLLSKLIIEATDIITS